MDISLPKKNDLKLHIARDDRKMLFWFLFITSFVQIDSMNFNLRKQRIH